MTIGIIALAIGVLSAVVGLWGLATLAWTDTLAPPQMAGDEAAARSFRDMMRWNAVLGLAKAVAAVVLIVGGAFIIQRRLAGARLVMVWSGLKMAIGLVVTYVTFDAQRKMMGGMTTAGAGAPPPGFFAGMATATAIMMLLWEWAAPVFFLIWFAVPGVRAEVRNWGKGARGGGNKA